MPSDGQLRGTVWDATRSVVAGATVVVTSPQLIGGPRTIATQPDGQWRVAALPAGDYTTSVSASGFTMIVHDRLRLLPGVTLIVDAELAVAALSAQTRVDASRPAVDVTTAAVTYTLGEPLLRGLPTARALRERIGGERRHRPRQQRQSGHLPNRNTRVLSMFNQSSPNIARLQVAPGVHRVNDPQLVLRPAGGNVESLPIQIQGTVPVRNSVPTAPVIMFAAVALLASGQGVAMAQTISWIDVGLLSQPCGGLVNIAFNPTTSRLYQTGWGATGSTVAVIDDTTDVVTQDHERLVSHEMLQLPNFQFYHCLNNQGHQGQYLVVNPATNRIYMLGYVGDVDGFFTNNLGLAVLDGATNNVTYVHPFGDDELYTGYDIAIAVNPRTNRIYFAGHPRGDGTVVVVVDGVTHEVVRRYSQPTWVDPAWPDVTCTFTPVGGIAVNPNTNRVYITGTGGGQSCNRFLGVIDEGTGEFTVLPKYARSADPLEYFEANNGGQVTVDTTANRVFVRGGFRGGVNDIIAVDEATGLMAVISTVSSPFHHGGMVVNSLTHRLYVVSGTDRLSLIDLVTGNERIAVELPPDWSFARAYNPEPAIDVDRNRLYVLSSQRWSNESAWINVIDLGTSEVATGPGVSVQADSASITFDSVTTAGLITVTPIADPSTAGQVPGGFAISDLVAYQITPSTSLVFSGTAVTCFQMPGIDDPETFATLRVLHMEDGVLVDRTRSLEFSTRTLCAATTSFSPFYVARAGNSVKILFNQTRAYRAGSTIPIRVQMLDRAGANISSSSLTLTTRGLASIGNATVLPVSDAGNANPDSAFRYDPALVGYIFNLKTTGLATGRHVLSFWAGVDRSFFYAVVFDVR